MSPSRPSLSPSTLHKTNPFGSRSAALPWESPLAGGAVEGIIMVISTHNVGIGVYIYIYILVGGFNPSEKYEFVSWDDSSQYMEKKHVPNHQPDIYIYIYYG